MYLPRPEATGEGFLEEVALELTLEGWGCVSQAGVGWRGETVAPFYLHVICSGEFSGYVTWMVHRRH